MIFLVATPIGNLSDITFRAIETLGSCDYILCEDTRYSLRLLQHYKIYKPCRSFHKFNEARAEDAIIEELKAGKKIALISDAGTPGISDPGEQLVKRCVQEKIKVISIPGPCAAVAALSCSGFSTTQFQFCGFLPRTDSAVKKVLLQFLQYPGTTLCYESPKRLLATLKVIQAIAPNRQLAVARELTKIHEELIRGTAKELLTFYPNSPKGEIVLLIEGDSGTSTATWEALSPAEHVMEVEQTYHLSRRDAIKMVATLRGESKRDIYNLLLSKNTLSDGEFSA
ncbi:MAG: 16S rRNA (cytidine(1402)-2'-O)-methyltransferase [Parachlamydiaceae bacterium]|nr:16S rRNA (cytidine(1402)-2'-O)-methyltransferase [Parachlamydiaceae bacterium]